MTEKGSNHQLLKQRNLSLIMKHIYRNSPISRVEIAHDLGLTTPTITGLVAPMIAEGLLRETVQASEELKGAGRPRVMLEFCPEAFYCCGVEAGPYYINYALTDFRGRVIRAKHTEETLDAYDKTLQVLAREIPALLESAGVPREKLLGVCVCLPGLIDGSAGKIYTTFHEGWTEHNLAEELGEILGARVQVENNVRARAICADLFDRAVNAEPFAYFFVSYGVACQMIIDGKVLYGQKAAAGEIGHTVMQRNGPVCPTCGNRGCLEALAGEWAVLNSCRALMREGRAPLLTKLARDGELRIEHVLEAQRMGDAAAKSVVEEALNYLGIALANTVNLISPREIVLDGRMLEPPENQRMLIEAVRGNMFRVHRGEIHLAFLPYDAQRGARAAAAVVVREFLQNNIE